MNKKFFTLIASVLMLVASLGTVSGQGIVPGTPISKLPYDDSGKYLYQLGVAIGATSPGTTIPNVLYLNSNSELAIKAWGDYTYRKGDDFIDFTGEYGRTLWCITFGQWEFDGSFPAGLQFLNQFSQKYLMANADDSKKPISAATQQIKVDDGNLSVWGMSSVFSMNIQQPMPIYSYFSEDSVVVLLYNSTAITTYAPIGFSTARISADDFFTGIYGASSFSAGGTNGGFFNAATGASGNATLGGSSVAQYMVWVTVMKPAPYVLDANDFNTRLQTITDNNNYLTTDFTVKPANVTLKNPWETYALRATNVDSLRIEALNNTYSTNIPGDGGAGSYITSVLSPQVGVTDYHLTDYWVTFKLKNSLNYNKPDDIYLRVDTAYADKNAPNLVFKFEKKPVIYNSAGAVVSSEQLEGQYYFRLTYNPYNDSLGIDVAQARYVSTVTNVPDEDKYFDEGNYGGIGGSYPGNYAIRTWEGYADGLGTKSGVWSDPALDPRLVANGWEDADYLHIGLRYIGNNQTRLLTVLEPDVHTYAKLGVQPCDVTGAVTVPEGLYVIGFGTGISKTYLGVPINTDSILGGKYPPGMLNLQNVQDPQRMPSYQWIVKHTSTSKTSPVKLINREYPNIVYNYVQLLDNGPSQAPPKVRHSWFTLVDKKLSLDETLGYYSATEQELYMNTYAFNFMHGLNDKTYLGTGAQTNTGSSTSVNGIMVKDSKDEWRLELIEYEKNGEIVTDPVPYGYKPSKDDIENLNIAQLKRNAYKITLASSGQVMHIDQQRIYTVATQPVYDDGTPYLGSLSHINGYNNIYGGGPSTALNTGIQDYGVFLLKTHNTNVAGKDYYAFLDTNSYFGRYNKWLDNNAAGGNWFDSPVQFNHYADSDYYANAAGRVANIPLKISFAKLNIVDASVVSYAQSQIEEQTSAFSVEPYAAPLYRRFDGGSYLYGDGDKLTKEVYGDATNSPLFLKFFSVPLTYNYLYENSKETNKLRSGLINKDISFLGTQPNMGDFKELHKAGKEGDYVVNYEFYVDTAFVKRNTLGQAVEPYTPMPQYMLALRPDILPGGSVWYRPGSSIWYEKPENPDDLNTGDLSLDDLEEKVLPGMVRGFYLFNAIDSLNSNPNGADYIGKNVDNIVDDARFAFVDGVHLGDTFYVLPEKNGRSTVSIQRDYDTYLYNLPAVRKHYLGENTHYVPRYLPYNIAEPGNKGYWRMDSELGYDDDNNLIMQNGKSMVFQFRLKPSVINKEREFFIETENIRTYYGSSGEMGDNRTTWLNRWFYNSDLELTKMNVNSQYEIGPNYAIYLNDHNHAVVRSEPFNVRTQGHFSNDAALGLNVEAGDGEGLKDRATSVEAATLDGAKVIGGTGNVTILNAAGKTVTVTNVLGQTVAKTVVSSDNATIALPKGIVVVSVDGNSSKAVVK